MNFFFKKEKKDIITTFIKWLEAPSQGPWESWLGVQGHSKSQHTGVIMSYPMPTLEDVAPRLEQAKILSVVDAKDGFLQVVLDKPSSLLTTFWTPFGHYKWNRLPF